MVEGRDGETEGVVEASERVVEDEYARDRTPSPSTGGERRTSEIPPSSSAPQSVAGGGG